MNYCYTENQYDSVRVYAGADTTAPLLKVYQGFLAAPDSVFANSGSMLVRFTSDQGVTFSGWDAHYKADVLPNSGNLLVFPNPATNSIRINLFYIDKENLHFEIYSDNGQLITKQSYSEDPTDMIDLSGYTKGLYIIRLTNNHINKTAKFCIE